MRLWCSSRSTKITVRTQFSAAPALASSNCVLLIGLLTKKNFPPPSARTPKRSFSTRRTIPPAKSSRAPNSNSSATFAFAGTPIASPTKSTNTFFMTARNTFPWPPSTACATTPLSSTASRKLTVSPAGAWAGFSPLQHRRRCGSPTACWLDRIVFPAELLPQARCALRRQTRAHPENSHRRRLHRLQAAGRLLRHDRYFWFRRSRPRAISRGNQGRALLQIPCRKSRRGRCPRLQFLQRPSRRRLASPFYVLQKRRNPRRRRTAPLETPRLGKGFDEPARSAARSEERRVGKE